MRMVVESADIPNRKRVSPTSQWEQTVGSRALATAAHRSVGQTKCVVRP